MAALRLLLLLHVGLAIGPNLRSADLDRDRDRDREAVRTPRRPPAPPQLPEPPRVAEEELLPRVVAAFLHTGDSTALERANCSRRYELTSLRGRSRAAPHRSVSGALDAVLRAANFLDVILQANRSRDRSPRRDTDWYRALVGSLLDGDANIHRAVVTLEAPAVLLRATRAGGGVVLQDLSGAEWNHAGRSRRRPGLQRGAPNRDLTSAEGPARRGESVAPERNVRWSGPYLECENGNLVPRWLLTLSAALHGPNPDLAPESRGVVRVDINLQDVDIDQCAADGWFAGTHRCNTTTMECRPVRGHGFILDQYRCHCRKGFYHHSRLAGTGRTAEATDGDPDAAEGSSNDCLPCQQGCAYCKDDTPCVAWEDGALRMAVLSFQCLCSLALFVSMVLVYLFRRNKSIRASGLVLLEAILCGGLLLYFPVGILFFQPSVFRCILLRWVRLLGFATVYGTLTLKLYRVLKVFLSRTAQRIPYMTSWRVLRLLAIILLVVCWFLVAWTSSVCQNLDRKSALIEAGYTPEGLQFSMCLLDRWDYMMAVAEFLFLLWAVYLCYAVRTVPSAFHEPRYMAIAVHNELVLSAIFYVIRFTLAPELHPDWMLLLVFAHTHLTVTVTLGLLLVPKFLFAGTHMRDDMASEAYEDELDMGRSGSYLNSSITSAWSEHSLDPEDIREELKKLYSQLEIYKRKKMLANNPHLQKKRSSKKGLGRSLMRRITEIPESVHRQYSREDKDTGEHGSNRNSICMLKKNPFDPTHSGKPVKEEPLKNKVFSLKKSHSSYDHVRDQSEDSNGPGAEKTELTAAEGSLLETLMGKKLVKKKSSENVNAPSESTESVPLVCKSASAHNLTADKKPRASMLQKSLSVIASAREKTLGLTGKTQSSEDSNKKTQPKSKDTRTNAEPENECQSTMIVSQSVEYKHGVAKGRVMKQPAGGSQPTVCPDPLKGKDLYDLSEVCPWEVEDLPTPSENKVQKHVSIAPTETTTVHRGGAKGGRSQQQKQRTDQSAKETQRTTTVRTEARPWEDGSAGQGEGLKQQTCSQASSLAKTQKPLCATESSKTKPVEVCPWDFEDPQKTTELARSPDTTKQSKGASPVDGKGKGTLSDPPRTGGSLQPPCTKADVCPWDYDSTARPPSTGQTTQASKTKESSAKKKAGPSARTGEKEKSKDADEEKNRTKAKDKSKSSEKHVSQEKMAAVCPWDTESHQEVPLVEKRNSANVGAAKAKPADVCPWDFEDTDKRSSDRRVEGGGTANKADVCPWEFDDSTSSKTA